MMLKARAMKSLARVESPMNEDVWPRRTVVAGIFLLLATIWTARIRAPELTLFLVQTQDFPILTLLSVSILILVFWQPRWRLPAHLPAKPLLLGAGLIVAALL